MTGLYFHEVLVSRKSPNFSDLASKTIWTLKCEKVHVQLFMPIIKKVITKYTNPSEIKKSRVFFRYLNSLTYVQRQCSNYVGRGVITMGEK